MLNLNNMAGCITERYFYEYIGSTTTPGCTEDVRWLIAREPLPLKTASKDMILANKQTNPNNRDVQDLNGRKVKLIGEPCQAIIEARS